MVVEKKIFKQISIRMYGRGGHVGHVTPIQLYNFLFLKALEAVYEAWLQSARCL